jgi:hypothetical protein
MHPFKPSAPAYMQRSSCSVAALFRLPQLNTRKGHANQWPPPQTMIAIVHLASAAFGGCITISPDGQHRLVNQLGHSKADAMGQRNCSMSPRKVKCSNGSQIRESVTFEILVLTALATTTWVLYARKGSVNGQYLLAAIE